MTTTPIKERPILMSAPMVRALLAGTKTQTRRVIKPQPHKYVDDFFPLDTLECFKPIVSGPSNLLDLPEMEQGSPSIHCPYGKRGDRLWVRETFFSYETTVYSSAGKSVSPPKYIYAADGGVLLNGAKWKPSIFMPRVASRITLEVTEVRVQRLQEISAVDAIDEGVFSLDQQWIAKHFREYHAAHDAWRQGDLRAKPPIGPSPSQRYSALWESINGQGSWDANPWVWAVSFKVVQA